jgi:RecB family endonuclease NucS
MVKTPYEGRKGMVIRMTECFVWVKLDDTYELLQKKKHNVKIVAGEN